MLVAAPKQPALLAAALSFVALAWLIAWRGSIEVASDLGFVRCVYGFGLGFVTYQLFRRGRPQVGTLIEFGIVAAIVLFVSLASGRWTFAAPPLFAVSIYFLAAGEGVVSRTLRRRGFQFLGMVSYSIYMIHYFVEQRLIDVLRLVAPSLTARTPEGLVISTSSWLADLLTVAALGFVVVLSFATYRLIERPGQRIARELLPGTRTRHPAAAE
jgi:peptidoglycan/LPS O-acetylase OafA/YrhL